MTLTEKLAAEIAADMETLGGNVMPFPTAKPVGAATPLPAAPDIDGVVAMHQGAVETFTARAAAARKAGRARVAELTVERRAEKERHENRMREIAAEIDRVKEAAAAAITANEQIAESSRLALGGLS